MINVSVIECTAAVGAVERLYTVKELAAIWKLSTTSMIRIFRDEIGVLKIRRNQIRRGST
jgi:hypothetical protein